MDLHDVFPLRPAGDVQAAPFRNIQKLQPAISSSASLHSGGLSHRSGGGEEGAEAASTRKPKGSSSKASDTGKDDSRACPESAPRPWATCACVCGDGMLAIAMHDGTMSWIISRDSFGVERRIAKERGEEIKVMRWADGVGAPLTATLPWSKGSRPRKVVPTKSDNEGIGSRRQGKLLAIRGSSYVFMVREQVLFSDLKMLHGLLWSGHFRESPVTGAEWWRWRRSGADLACVALADGSIIIIDPIHDRGRLCTVRCDITQGVTGLIKVNDAVQIQATGQAEVHPAKAAAALSSPSPRPEDPSGQELDPQLGEWGAVGTAASSRPRGVAGEWGGDWWEHEDKRSEQALVLTTAEEGCFVLLLDVSRLLHWAYSSDKQGSTPLETVAVNHSQASPNAAALLRHLPFLPSHPTLATHPAPLCCGADAAPAGPTMSIVCDKSVSVLDAKRVSRTCEAGWYDACAFGTVIKRGFGWPYRWVERLVVIKRSGTVEYYASRGGLLRSEELGSFHLSRFCHLRRLSPSECGGRQFVLALLTDYTAKIHDEGGVVLKGGCRRGRGADTAGCVALDCESADGFNRWGRVLSRVIDRMEGGGGEGTLVKRGNEWPHAWRVRPVDLMGNGYLRYFKDEAAQRLDEERGAYRLTGLTTSFLWVDAADTDCPQHAFVITDVVNASTGESENLYFAANSAADSENWVSSVNRIVYDLAGFKQQQDAPAAPSLDNRHIDLQHRTSSPLVAAEARPPASSRDFSPKVEGSVGGMNGWKANLRGTAFEEARLVCVYGRFAYFALPPRKTKEGDAPLPTTANQGKTPSVGAAADQDEENGRRGHVESILVMTRTNPPVVLQTLSLPPGDLGGGAEIESCIAMFPIAGVHQGTGTGTSSSQDADGISGPPSTAELAIVCSSGAVHSVVQHSAWATICYYLARCGDLATGTPNGGAGAGGGLEDRVWPMSLPTLFPAERGVMPPLGGGKDGWASLGGGDMAVDGRGLTLEQLCVSVTGKNLTEVYERAAHQALSEGNSRRASDLFHLACVAPSTAVSALRRAAGVSSSIGSFPAGRSHVEGTMPRQRRGESPERGVARGGRGESPDRLVAGARPPFKEDKGLGFRGESPDRLVAGARPPFKEDKGVRSMGGMSMSRHGSRGDLESLNKSGSHGSLAALSRHSGSHGNLAALSRTTSATGNEHGAMFLADWLERRRLGGGGKDKFQVVRQLGAPVEVDRSGGGGVKVESGFKLLLRAKIEREIVRAREKHDGGARLLLLLIDTRQYSAAAEVYRDRRDEWHALLCELASAKLMGVSAAEGIYDLLPAALSGGGRGGAGAADALLLLAKVWLAAGLDRDALEQRLLADVMGLVSTEGLIAALQGRMSGVHLSSSSSSYSLPLKAPLAPSPSTTTTSANSTPNSTVTANPSTAMGAMPAASWGVVESGWSSRLGLEQGDWIFPFSHAFMIKLMVAQAGMTDARASSSQTAVGSLKDEIIKRLHRERASVKQTPEATPIPSPAGKPQATHFSNNKRGASSLSMRSPTSGFDRARPPAYPPSNHSSSFSIEPELLAADDDGVLDVAASGGWEPWGDDTSVESIQIMGLVDDPLDSDMQQPGGERRGSTARRGDRAARSLRLSG